MCDFKPGDEVVCIIAGMLPWQGRDPALPTAGLTEGATYSVHYVGLDDDDEITVWLNETGNFCDDGIDWGYCPIRFRKVERRDWSVWLAAENTIENPNPVHRRKRETA
jgi:hypothetical protein